MPAPSFSEDACISMRRRLPSLNALKAFEATARQQSLTRAADELCVTQGAVSQQVKSLEAELGVRLFRRERQRLVITESGREYLEVVRDAFDRLALGTERLVQGKTFGTLSVTTSPNFAAKWLMHRLGCFANDHPEIVLRVSASVEHVDFAREDVDVAIRHGTGRWPGMHVTRLCTEELFPVCSPKLLQGRTGLRSLRDLAQHALIHVDDATAWTDWLARMGADGVDVGRGITVNQASMAIDAAIAGQGVALARTALAVGDLLAERLVRPFMQALDAPFAYWVVCPKPTADLPKISIFRRWLLREAERDESNLARLDDRTPRSTA